MTLPSTSPRPDGPIPAQRAPASPLASLMDALQSRIAVLYARQQAPCAAADRAASDEGAAIWTLHVLGTAYSALSALNCARVPQPDQVLDQLQQLAGSLLSVASSPPDTALAGAAPRCTASRDSRRAHVDALIRSLLARAPGGAAIGPAVAS